MSKNKTNTTPRTTNSTPSNATTLQDKLNLEILASRIKKEEEAEVRKAKTQEKQKPKTTEDKDDTQINPSDLPSDFAIGTSKIPISENSLTQKPLKKKKVQNSNPVNSQANEPNVPEVNPKLLKGILTFVGKKTKTPENVKPLYETLEEEAHENDMTPSIALLSKPGSKNLIKTITFKASLEELGQKRASTNPEKELKIIKNRNSLSLSQPTKNDASHATETVILRTDSSLMSRSSGTPDPYRHSDRPIAISRGGEDQREIDQELLISNNTRGKHRVNESLLNILKSGKDEAMHVTIIPADEAKVLQRELKQWKVHRIAFLILFGVAMILGFGIVTLTMYSSIKYFIIKASKYDEEIHEANKDFILHTDFMIIGTVFFNAIGILIFRLFPSLTKCKVVRIHVAIFSLTCLLFVYGFGVAIVTHDLVTGRPEHMYTLHAMVGLMICAFLLFEIGTGIYVMVRPNGSTVKYHSAVGMMTFMLSGACCVSGYLVRSILFSGTTAAMRQDSKNVVVNITGVLIIIFCCLVRHLAADFRFRRRARPEWDTVFFRSTTSLEDSNIDREGYTLDQYVRRNNL